MKIAISLPDPVFQAAERFAKERGMARSQLVAEALEAYLAQHGAEAITAQLDQVYATQDSELDEAWTQVQSTLLQDEAW
ncbi:CopG family ribbon-helix-helix protein [Wenzhouxiangella sediminis]|uniref:ChpI protein n=1 Tax=Wenzhouxiangella sediminis TaxID=1792836 RepID=A0A3E1KC96_9GAMM|nr:ChpI protein [Wenzhouxiangella sediminis]RFF32401.1 ChpI protein [Wenzhouxiangella sediminis]